MNTIIRTLKAAVAVVTVFVTSGAPAPDDHWNVPIVTKRLSNGLTLVISEDHSAPTFGLCLSYGIGSRLEPKGRTGFAHLFEHIMFDATPKTPKGVFDRVVYGAGGRETARTYPDYTDYLVVAPVSVLDRVLWLEADRMKGMQWSPATLENERQAVQEELRVNFMNRPYGTAYQSLKTRAFDSFPNAHDEGGSFEDLDAAGIDDLKAFFQRYYTPANAVLAIVGDVRAEDAFARVEKYFKNVPYRPRPERPEVREKQQNEERRVTQVDKFAPVPALTIGFRMPERGSRDAIVAAVTGELLHKGNASRLYQRLVREKRVANRITGGLNSVYATYGDPFGFQGPTLMISSIIIPAGVKEDDVLSAYNSVIAELAGKEPAEEELDRVITKMRSDWYAQLETPFSRAAVLARTVLFDGNAKVVNEMPHILKSVNTTEVRNFVNSYLRQANRTVVTIKPAALQSGPGR